MNTVVKDWSLVSIIDNEHCIGQVLWGFVVEDMSCRYLTDDYVSTSKVIKIYHQLITTNSGSIYQVIGKDRLSTISYDDFELLRSGFSPEQIFALSNSSKPTMH
jgi:hypothetical protein